MTQKTKNYFNTVLTVFIGLLLSLTTWKIFDVIYNYQNVEFIDEIFHVPQAKLYCQNQWTEWNPKITTLPGLYIVSYIFLKPLEIFGYKNLCSLYALRFTNVIATVLNFAIGFKISCLVDNKYKLKSNPLCSLLTGLNIAIFPPLYFFTFLYYTDVWSTTFVLLMYYLHLSNGKFSGILGAIVNFMAVLMRQTNIIWVGFMILEDAWSILCNDFKAPVIQNYSFSKKVCQKLILDIFNSTTKMKSVSTLIYNILLKTFHNVFICLLFFAFIIINKSIVLGDKEAHSVSIHPMQNLYFLGFLSFFGWPFLISEAFSLWKKPPNTFLFVFLTGLCAVLSEVNKLEHPYLLADNRHLAFYLWKRIFGHWIFRRAIVPTYVISGILLLRLVHKKCHFMTVIILSVCVFLNLTPQYLFELRYFIIPFLMYRLFFKQSLIVILESLFFIVINSTVIYLFLNRPFVWQSEPNILQRFIW